MKLSPNIKRKQVKQSPQREFEHVLPAAISAISNRLDAGIEVHEVYICLKNGKEYLSYDYKKE
ncbi:hypothetical protein [Lactococcus petauri]|uniref:hypothetical protein n=1 Tax=Lactococcus petauri TaxID=1940789 RepID=UPI0038519941